MNTQFLSWLNNPWVALGLVAWSLCWKGPALWRAARSSDRNWFVILLLVNTLGLLEIFYLFFWELFKKIVVGFLDRNKIK